MWANQKEEFLLYVNWVCLSFTNLNKRIRKKSIIKTYILARFSKLKIHKILHWENNVLDSLLKVISL